jgi:hypothetical protein
VQPEAKAGGILHVREIYVAFQRVTAPTTPICAIYVMSLTALSF